MHLFMPIGFMPRLTLIVGDGTGVALSVGMDGRPLIPAKPQVVVVDHDPAVRTSVQNLLEASGYRVRTSRDVDEAGCGEQLQEPGCMVVELSMSPNSPDEVDVNEMVQRAGARLPVVFLSACADIRMSVRAMRAGAVDFLAKPVQPEQLLEAVDRAVHIDAQAAARRQRLNSLRSRYAGLTSRERQVMAEVTAGKLNKQIAFDFGIAEKTVKVHRGRVMEKMEARSLADLVRIAQALGISASDLADADPNSVFPTAACPL
jgi:FixJ family two-component response regulator